MPEGGKTRKICFHLICNIKQWCENLTLLFFSEVFAAPRSTVCLQQQLCYVLDLKSWDKPCLATLWEYCWWCAFHKMRVQHWRGVEGKVGEDRRETMCGLRHWQVQRFVSLCLCVHVSVLEGVWALKRAEDFDGKRGKRYCVGQAGSRGERRMEGDMLGDWCKWEEQYGGRRLRSAANGVLLISGSLCLCKSICIPCWYRSIHSRVVWNNVPTGLKIHFK